MAFLTVFTPAYNRAHTLQRTYESLCRQECKDFLWLIIDDGSTDQTSELVQSWQKKENGFEIQYIYKENGGMHTAHNTAYENIHTELNVCIDSDDWIAPGAVKKIRDTWEKVRDKGYAGMIALDADFSGNIMEKVFRREWLTLPWVDIMPQVDPVIKNLFIEPTLSIVYRPILFFRVKSMLG